MRGGFETSFPLDPIKSHITSRWIHEISQAQSSVLRNPPPADRSSPQHEHNAAPWFISCSIYPFKMNWINELSIKSMTLKHDGLLRLSSGNAETPFNEECIGLIGRQMRSEYKWCSVWSSSGHGYCVHEYFCLFFCFVFFWLGNFPHNFSPRFPKSQLLTCCYIISLKEFLEALELLCMNNPRQITKSTSKQKCKALEDEKTTV